ncbi:uncharacterized protein Z518_05128 [Rhinocladiella mackenziei CBS 650.93]|uniref:Rhinocladiella mackenziei CBS 650.93 unplaced genomic scaffold supercont1.3, whole genome shotgun sequence n=1 Tax=Rhinocladiella mackenziei CBS 650.93 TaxID=1442369 RepID=A0A0D2IVD5_9EURO|nr:uncharacterized protein Z518_05128 [Rhinocladiella mackenziei CBS 650.93]KIX07151.1 hypothetical protein Z518_05128 [Rhinocladiella mackenziei CBS 650.93]
MEQNAPRYSQATLVSRLKSQAQSEDPTKSSFLTSTSKTRSDRTQITKTATVRDSDFEDTQLLPRGIEIVRSGRWNVGGAYGHFGSETPLNAARSREFYRSIVRKALAGRADWDIDSSIFLPMDVDFITSVLTTYRIMRQEEALESDFKTYAIQKLFIGPYAVLEHNVARQLSAVRWAGYTIRILDSGKCRDEQGVTELLQWINEIHRWGLCEYALGCEEDIKQILNQASGNLRMSGTVEKV